MGTAVQHHGKELSYNNYLDADAAYSTGAFYCCSMCCTCVCKPAAAAGISSHMRKVGAAATWTPTQPTPRVRRGCLQSAAGFVVGVFCSLQGSSASTSSTSPPAACDFAEPTCVIVKHTNPCGVASRDDLLEAYRLAVIADPISAFGGIVAFNRCATWQLPCVLLCALTILWQ